MQNKLVAELFLPIPEPSHMSGRLELECFEFSSDQQVFYKHEGVGSGEFLLTKTDTHLYCNLYTLNECMDFHRHKGTLLRVLLKICPTSSN